MKVDLFSPSFIVFTTRHYAVAAELSLSAASKKLSRLEKDQLIKKISKGVWANIKHPWFDPRACVPLLLGNEQGYVSFLTVLHDEGVLSQIPKTIQVATSGHSRKLASPVGQFEFIQIKPELMQRGVEWSETKTPYQKATVERALFDCLYVSTRKGKRFAKMPELDLDGEIFDKKQFEGLVETALISVSIASAINSRYGKLMSRGC